MTSKVEDRGRFSGVSGEMLKYRMSYNGHYVNFERVVEVNSTNHP